VHEQVKHIHDNFGTKTRYDGLVQEGTGLYEPRKLYVSLRAIEAEALMRLARQEDRPVQSQAARLLRQALRDHGVLDSDATNPEPIREPALAGREEPAPESVRGPHRTGQRETGTPRRKARGE
jgi:hypothetical protein